MTIGGSDDNGEPEEKGGTGQEGGAGEEGGASQEGGTGQEGESPEEVSTGDSDGVESEAEQVGDSPLGAFIEVEVRRAEVVFDSYRQRAGGLIATSTSVLGVSAGLLALASGSPRHHLPCGLPYVVGAASLSFVIAIGLSLAIHYPIQVVAAKASEMPPMLDGFWDAPNWPHRIAGLNLKYLEKLRLANKRFAWLLSLSILAQLFAVASTAAAAIMILWSRSQ